MPRLRKNLPPVHIIEKDKRSKTKEFLQKLGFTFGDKYYMRMIEKSQGVDPVIGEIQQLEQVFSIKMKQLEANFEDRLAKEMAEMKKSLLVDMKKLLKSRPVK